MKVVWPTRSRTGSQFVLNLTTRLYGAENLIPQARVNGARVDRYKEEEKEGLFKEDGIGYLKRNNIVSLKYEDPGKDDFILEVADCWPEAKFVCSYRPLPLVIASHYNIKSWGHDEADVIYQFSASLALYEQLHQWGRLVMIDVSDNSHFSLEKVASFLGVKPTPSSRKIVSEWEPINTLHSQISRYGGTEKDVSAPPRIERLFEIHPWAAALEERYRQICRETSQLGS
jgi:hypothetical protein